MRLLKRVKQYKHWKVLVPLLLSGAWFSLLERIVRYPEYYMYNSIDHYIPFIPLFIIPYVIWYAYVGVTAVLLFRKAPEEFNKMAAFLAAGMLIACTIYTLFPNGQFLRPSLIGCDGLLTDIIRLIYATDTPTNSAPSIHVVYSIAAHAAIRSYNNGTRRIAWINAASLVLAVLCAVSTVFVKQHSVIDVVAGVLLSMTLYTLIYGVRRERVMQEV